MHIMIATAADEIRVAGCSVINRTVRFSSSLSGIKMIIIPDNACVNSSLFATDIGTANVRYFQVPLGNHRWNAVSVEMVFWSDGPCALVSVFSQTKHCLLQHSSYLDRPLKWQQVQLITSKQTTHHRIKQSLPGLSSREINCKLNGNVGWKQERWFWL